ncbi:MAG: YfhO family protein [Coriobacteriia bacterium]|nr:YfhO family protein [Coriobacteriia bacterium]
MGQRAGNKVVAAAQRVANFLVPIALLCVFCAVCNVYPFGENSFLAADLQIQYVDFFAWFQGVLAGTTDLLYVPNQGLGNGSWGMVGYYLSSPFNVLLLLFDADHITLFVFVSTALKLGCIQLATTHYLRKRFNLGYVPAAVLAAGFTLCLWNLTNMRNLIWLDAVIVLPLMAWGAYCLVNHGRWKLLLFSLVYALVTCWYMGYMLYIFLFIYGMLELHLRFFAEPDFTGRHLLKGTLPFVGVAVLALCLAAFTFLPSVQAMTGAGESRVSEFPSWVYAVTLAVVALLCVFFAQRRIPGRAKLVVGLMLVVALLVLVTPLSFYYTCSRTHLAVGLLAPLWIDNKTPQLAPGVVTLLLAAAFFLIPTIPRYAKTAVVAVLAVMIVSVWFKPLHYIWCGFRAPDGFYARNAIFFVFMLYFAAGWALSQVPAWWEAKRGRWPGRGARVGAQVLFAGVMLADVAVVALFALPGCYADNPQVYYDAYETVAKQQQQALTALDPGVYRVEKTYNRTGNNAQNEGMAVGFLQLSSYTSSKNAAAETFLNQLGYGKVESENVHYGCPAPLTDSLFGVKYVAAHDPVTTTYYRALDIQPTWQDAAWYENPTALSLGYVVDSGAREYVPDAALNAFEQQNAFVSALVGHRVDAFVPLEAEVVATAEDGTVTWAVQVPAGVQAYFWAEPVTVVANRVGKFNVSAEGRTWMENFPYRHNIDALAAPADQARTVQVTLQVETGESYPNALHFCYLDTAAMQEALAQLAEHQMTFTTFQGSLIEGDISCSEDSTLMLTIPPDAGWTVTVNGNVVETGSIAGDALLAIPVSAGENHVRLTYEIPGLKAGVAVSLLAVVVLVVLLVRERKRKR